MSLFAGSKANANAGNVSVTKFIHSMCIGNNISKLFMSVIPNHFANSGVNNVAKSHNPCENKQMISHGYCPEAQRGWDKKQPETGSR